MSNQEFQTRLLADKTKSEERIRGSQEDFTRLSVWRSPQHQFSSINLQFPRQALGLRSPQRHPAETGNREIPSDRTTVLPRPQRNGGSLLTLRRIIPKSLNISLPGLRSPGPDMWISVCLQSWPRPWRTGQGEGRDQDGI